METPKILETITLPARKVGEAVLWLFSMHQLSEHGAHFIPEPTDTTQENQGVLNL